MRGRNFCDTMVFIRVLARPSQYVRCFHPGRVCWKLAKPDDVQRHVCTTCITPPEVRLHFFPAVKTPYNEKPKNGGVYDNNKMFCFVCALLIGISITYILMRLQLCGHSIISVIDPIPQTRGRMEGLKQRRAHIRYYILSDSDLYTTPRIYIRYLLCCIVAISSHTATQHLSTTYKKSISIQIIRNIHDAA